jgi:hypothetical protein
MHAPGLFRHVALPVNLSFGLIGAEMAFLVFLTTTTPAWFIASRPFFSASRFDGMVMMTVIALRSMHVGRGFCHVLRLFAHRITSRRFVRVYDVNQTLILCQSALVANEVESSDLPLYVREMFFCQNPCP